MASLAPTVGEFLMQRLEVFLVVLDTFIDLKHCEASIIALDRERPVCIARNDDVQIRPFLITRKMFRMHHNGVLRHKSLERLRCRFVAPEALIRKHQELRCEVF